MARGGSAMSLALPPFTKAVKQLVIINIAVYVLMLLLSLTVPTAEGFLSRTFYLFPNDVLHGRIWELVTYAFFHAGIMHLLFNMLSLWMFGSQFEMDWGTNRFIEFFLWCVIGAALTSIAIGVIGALMYSRVPVPLFDVMRNILFRPTVGASGGIYGLLIAFGMLYGDREIIIFPLPIPVKARIMVFVWLLIAFVSAFNGSNGVAEFAHLGGALFGFLYLKFGPRRGLQFATSEGVYGIRNRYYRWKRKRAAKKFEVYMRQHRKEDFFDEYGNYRGENDRDKKDGGNPWVN